VTRDKKKERKQEKIKPKKRKVGKYLAVYRKMPTFAPA
jgi:hypothetical protein